MAVGRSGEQQTSEPEENSMGPACAILLRPGSEDATADAVERLIGKAGYERDNDLFWIADSVAIGGRYQGEGRPFVADIEPGDVEQPHLDQIEAAFGFHPERELGIGAMCNQKEDHWLLAEVAAYLAAELAGVVDVGGILSLPDDHPGQIIILEYETVRSEILGSMVLDSEALWEWSRRPDCRMIK
jgi:hypothetical protein